MGLRHQFRPCAFDRLESRVVLSGLSPSSKGIVAVLAKAKAPALRVGALGDSYTDEYRFYRDGRQKARNWVEILAATRPVQFGPLSLASRGEPRNQGFASNWARSDATSDDMIRNQLPGLADQVRQGQVDVAWIFIGGNDFLAYSRENTTLAATDPEGFLRGLAGVEARAEENLATAVRTLLAADPNVKIVVATLPDIRLLPAVAATASLPGAGPVLNTVGVLMTKYNARIGQIAASEPTRVAVADLNGQLTALGQQAAATGKVRVGKTTINTRTPGNNYRNLFLSDGIHIGTVAQGYVANLFVRTVDSAFGARIKPLRPAEIVEFARMPRRR